jgi:hypothetical protein
LSISFFSREGIYNAVKSAKKREEEKKVKMTPMGNTDEKRCTMTDHV